MAAIEFLFYFVVFGDEEADPAFEFGDDVVLMSELVLEFFLELRSQLLDRDHLVLLLVIVEVAGIVNRIDEVELCFCQKYLAGPALTERLLDFAFYR